MTEQAPRSRSRRREDFLARLRQDVDAWFATSDEAGLPYLMPLSFLWAEESLIISTVPSNPTAVNFTRSGRVRVALGETRDVYLVDASVQALPKSEVSRQTGDAYATKCGFDPRELKSYSYYRVTPLTVQSWRELNELNDRDIMLDGSWVG